jgi:hypothetical protein
MSGKKFAGIMGERLSGEPAEAPRRETNPIAGPNPQPAPLTIGFMLLCAVGAIVGSWLLFSPPAAVAPAAPPRFAPTAAPSPVEQAPASPEPLPGPLAVLAADAVAYAAPDGAALGEVGGRAVLAYTERWDVSWVRAEVEGAGVVWVRMEALAGNAVDLTAIPCGTRCLPPPPPAPTARPAVAPAPVSVAPVAPAAPVVKATVAPTPCPIVMVRCGNYVEVRP